MALVRWNPDREINSLQRQIDRLFDDMLVPSHWRDFDHFSKVPPAELSETEDALYLKLEVPGMEASDFDIQVSRDSISVSGERKEEFLSEEKSSKMDWRGRDKGTRRGGDKEKLIQNPGIQNPQ
jgi:HSP20 family protein